MVYMSKHKRGAPPHEAPMHAMEKEAEQRAEVELLAYRYWEERGRPDGDSEIDWLRAEHEWERQREAATRL